MNSQNALRVDGVVIYTQLCDWTNLEQLETGLNAAGFAKFVPSPITPQAALANALSQTFPKTVYRVEKLASPDSWEVCEIIRGEDANDYPVKYVVRLKDETIFVGPYDPEAASKIVGMYNRFLGLVRYSQVTQAMNGILAALGGITLRPRGSVYWLPGHQVETWAKVCHAVEGAGDNRCYLIRHAMDQDALRAVRDAIIAEVQAEATRIQEEVGSGELGDRAIEHRKDQALALRDKIKLYEETLNVALTELHQAVDGAESAAMVAAMMCTVAAGIK